MSFLIPFRPFGADRTIIRRRRPLSLAQLPFANRRIRRFFFFLPFDPFWTELFPLPPLEMRPYFHRGGDSSLRTYPYDFLGDKWVFPLLVPTEAARRFFSEAHSRYGCFPPSTQTLFREPASVIRFLPPLPGREKLLRGCMHYVGSLFFLCCRRPFFSLLVARSTQFFRSSTSPLPLRTQSH